MPVVAEKQLQCMLTGAQRKFDLRLTASEVQMIEVTWDFLIQARQRSVIEKVMVAAIGPRICLRGLFLSHLRRSVSPCWVQFVRHPPGPRRKLWHWEGKGFARFVERRPRLVLLSWQE